MAFSSSTVSVGNSTKKSHFDQLLDNTNWNKGRLDPLYSGTVSLAGDITFSGTISIEDTLGVAGAVTLSSSLGVVGSAILSGTLTVAESATFNEDVIVKNDLSFMGDIYRETLVGDNAFLYANTERMTELITYVKIKEIFAPLSGNVRVSFDVKTNNASYHVWVDIRKNGASQEVGYWNNTAYETKTVDLLGIVPGDLIQAYYETANVNGDAYIKNFQLHTAAETPVLFQKICQETMINQD